MDKKPIGYIKGQSSVLDKKVKANPKYDGVKKTINTGLTARNIEVVSNQLLAKRKGEQFRRIKASQLATLLDTDVNTESIYNMNDYGQLDDQSVVSANSQISKATVTQAGQQVVLSEQSEFVLVDVREADEHAQWSIQQSVNSPFTLMMQDKWNQQMVGFKNKMDKLIIIFHLDEKSGIRVANHLFQKGYDNIYLLSGGVEEFTQECSHLVQGDAVPTLAKKESTPPPLFSRGRPQDPEEVQLQGAGQQGHAAQRELQRQHERTLPPVRPTEHTEQVQEVNEYQ